MAPCEQSELGVAALLKAAWQDLRLASLLTHLFLNSQFLNLFGNVKGI